MMFPYDPNFSPPALTLDVEVRNPQTGAVQQVLAKLDTGADSSIIPLDVARTLTLQPFDQLLSIAFDGQTSILESYLVELLIAGYLFVDLEVAAASLPYVLLGRDVLNELIVTMNGPLMFFEIP